MDCDQTSLKPVFNLACQLWIQKACSALGGPQEVNFALWRMYFIYVNWLFGHSCVLTSLLTHSFTLATFISSEPKEGRTCLSHPEQTRVDHGTCLPVYMLFIFYF